MAATASVFCRSVFLKRKGVCVSVLRRVGKILVEHISQIMILVVGHWCLFSGMKIYMSKRYGQHLLMCVNMHMSQCACGDQRDNMHGSVIAFYNVGLGIELRSLGLSASVFTTEPSCHLISSVSILLQLQLHTPSNLASSAQPWTS